MGSEYELKYRADAESLTSIFTTFPARWQTIAMETTYYDTFDGKMSNCHWTFRRRMENGTSVCTLKTPAEDGSRQEWEVEESSIIMSVPKLVKAGAPWILAEFTVSGVVPVCGAKFTRLAGQLEFGGARVELALDQGILTGGGREMPLLEVEVELKSGDESHAVAFARLLESKYGLVAEEKSKYRRALGLARGE